MTTGSGDAGRDTTTAAAPGRPGGRGLSGKTAAQLGLLAGFVALLAVTFAALLLLDNIYGPLGESASAGKWAALGCGAVVALAVLAVTQRVALRSSRAVSCLLVVWAVVGWVLFPQPIDVSESWAPQPNERYACTGWEFRHYPPRTFDASSTTYCIGLERRIVDG